MTPEIFAQAIVAIEQNYGLRLDARSVWLRMDEFKKVKGLAGGKCNEKKGWYGLKGACKRGKKGEGEVRSKESKVETAKRLKGIRTPATLPQIKRHEEPEKKEPEKVEPTKSPNPEGVKTGTIIDRIKSGELSIFKGDYSTLGKNTSKTLKSGDTVDINLVAGKKAVEVEFYVNGTFNAGTAKNGREVALGVRDQLKTSLSKLPEGTLLYNAPYDEDGQGSRRAKLYQKAGFSPMNEDGEMFAVMAKGKPTPISKIEYVFLSLASKKLAEAKAAKLAAAKASLKT